MPINAPPRHLDHLPAEIAVFPLSGCILLPRAELPLNIFEPRYLAMVEAALKGERTIGMIQPDPKAQPCARGPGLFGVGCAGRVTQFAETGDGRFLITLTGLARFRIAGEIASGAPYRVCRVDYSEFAGDLAPEPCCAARRAEVIDAFRRFASARRVSVDWPGVEETPSEALVNGLAMMSPFGVAEKQALVEAPTLEARAAALVALSEMTLAAPAASPRRREGGLQ